MFSRVLSSIPFLRGQNEDEFGDQFEDEFARPPPDTVSAASSFSITSTVVYGDHKPFTEIRPLVFDLCRTLWPNACHDATKVEQMVGGSNFRIIGLSIVHCQGSESTQYILRLPRFPHIPVDQGRQNYLNRHITYLELIQGDSQIPIADVVSFDITGENVLQEQYIIQRRAVGENAFYSYLTLDHDGKCNIARELGGIYRQFQQMRSNSPGFLAPGQHEDGSSSFSMIEGFKENDIHPPVRRDALPECSWSEMIIKIFEDDKADALESYYDWRANIMDHFIRIIKEMKALGYVDDDQNFLCHDDLSPHNIIIDSTTRPTISAVIGWTGAFFAPRFMSYEPPLWLWAWNHEKDWDYRGHHCYPFETRPFAEEIPANDESRELKRIFEEAAGPEYAQYDGPQYRILRNLFRYAMDNVTDSNDNYKLPIWIKEWAKISREEKRKRRGSFRSRMEKHFSDTANVLARPLPYFSRRYSPKPSGSP